MTVRRETMITRLTSRPSILWVSLGLVLVAGLVRVPTPLFGDQTLFLLGARSMDAGGLLYVDFWDNKQPGLFFFYWLGGRLFGFNGWGVHLLELTVWLAVVPVMVAAAGRWFRRPAVIGLMIALTGYNYYCAAGPWFMTQVEALVGPLLFLVLWSTERALAPTGKHPFRWMLVSGLFGSAVAALKLVLAPVVASMWFVALLVALRGETTKSAVAKATAGAPIGVALGLGAVAAAFAASGGLEAMLWTNFQYPLLAVEAVDTAPTSRLFRGWGWLLWHFLPGCLLAPFALVGRRRTSLPVAVCLTWVVAGELMIVAQKFSFWPYHQQLLVVPIGILACFGLEALMDRFSFVRPRVVVPALLVMLAFISLPLARHARRVLIAPWSSPEPYAVARHIDTGLDAVWRQSEILRRPDAAPGPIYVFGDPRILLVNERAYALPIHGWSWEFLLDPQWAALPAQLEAAAPPYIFVESIYDEVIAARSPQTVALLDGRYRPAARVALGTWYRLDGHDARRPPAGP